jgi:hypothetical protein
LGALALLLRVGEARGAEPRVLLDDVAPPRNITPSAPSDWRHSPALSPSLFNVPEAYSMAPPLLEPETKSFSSKDFRPRGRSILDADPRLNIADENVAFNTNVWRRLNEYRTHDRVQVLTIWNSTGSTVSLQAGKHGDPSLQWTSRLMNRGGATRGLLDRFMPRFNESARASHSVNQQLGKGSNSLGALLRPTP